MSRASVCGINAAKAKSSANKTEIKNQIFQIIIDFILVRKTANAVIIRIVTKSWIYENSSLNSGLSILNGSSFVRYLFTMTNPMDCARRKRASTISVIFILCFILIKKNFLYLNVNVHQSIANYLN